MSWRRSAAASIPGWCGPLPDSATAIALRAALARLPRRQRAVLVLRYFAGLGVTATAQALGVSPAAVRSLTHRAIVALRAHDRELAGAADEEVSGAS
jgi:DNA-directed RNA polymerase specialized sigma24 family protein